MSASMLARRTYSPQDLPMLRDLREAYRDLLAKAEAFRDDEKCITDHVALSIVVDELRAKFHAVGVLMTRLEESPRGRRIRAREIEARMPAANAMQLAMLGALGGNPDA